MLVCLLYIYYYQRQVFESVVSNELKRVRTEHYPG